MKLTVIKRRDRLTYPQNVDSRDLAGDVFLLPGVHGSFHLSVLHLEADQAGVDAQAGRAGGGAGVSAS